MDRIKLNYFLDYFHIKDFDSLCTIEIPKLKEIIEDYIYTEKTGLVFSKINNDISA